MPWAALVASVAAVWHLSRWRGLRTLREPLLLVLQSGYDWLAAGLPRLGVNGTHTLLPATAAAHALALGYTTIPPCAAPLIAYRQGPESGQPCQTRLR